MASAKTNRLPNISRSFVTTRGVGLDKDRPRDAIRDGRRARAGGVEAVVGGGQERRTLLGIGTYLIDTPRDSGLYMRQQFFDHQEQHRGVARSHDEVFTEIPYRLHPRPEPAHTGPAIDVHPHVATMDVATSPMTPWDDVSSDHAPSRSTSPIPPPFRSVTFMTDREVTSLSTVTTSDVSGATSTFGRKNRRNRGTSTSDFFSHKGSGLRPKQQLSENSKLSKSPVMHAEEKEENSHVAERLPRLPLTDRSEAASMKKSSFVADLTEVGSIFSWRDRDFEIKSSRSFDLTSEHIGPTSYLQKTKAKSLADLLKPSKGDFSKVADLAAYQKRQRIAQLAFRRENTVRQNSSLSGDEADKEWLDMKNTQVVDRSEYERFASRRKPESSAGKKSAKSYSPRSGVDFKLTHPVDGKLYPVFFNDGSPVRKFGRVTSRRKLSKR